MKSAGLLVLQLLLANFLYMVKACDFEKIKEIDGGCFLIRNVASSFLRKITKTTYQLFRIEPPKKDSSLTPTATAQRPPPTATPVKPKEPRVPKKPAPDASSSHALPSPSSPASQPPMSPPPPSPPSPPASPPSDWRPYVPLPPLDIEPKHMSRINPSPFVAKWSHVSGANHYKVQLMDFYWNQEIGLPRIVQENETSINITGCSIFEIIVSAFKSSDESIFITKESVHVVAINREPEIIIEKPEAVDGEDELKAKKGDWELKWQSVPPATRYTVVIVHNGKNIGVHPKIADVNIMVTSKNLGRHDVLLFAWEIRENKHYAVAWGKASVTVVEDE